MISENYRARAFTLEVEVYQRDILAGVRQSASHSPLALSMERALEQAWQRIPRAFQKLDLRVWVGGTVCYIHTPVPVLPQQLESPIPIILRSELEESGTIVAMGRTADAARKFLHDYHWNKPVEPFHFHQTFRKVKQAE